MLLRYVGIWGLMEKRRHRSAGAARGGVIRLKIRLAESIGIQDPIVLAALGSLAGGTLATAVSNAGELRIIGGEFGDADWLGQQFVAAEGSRLGCGFVT